MINNSTLETFTRGSMAEAWHEQAATMAPNFWPDLPHPKDKQFTPDSVTRQAELALSRMVKPYELAAAENEACSKYWDKVGNQSQRSARQIKIKQILSAIDQHPGSTVNELVQHTGYRRDYIARNALHLEKEGQIRIARSRKKAVKYLPIGLP